MSILNKQFFLNLTSFTIYLYPLSLIFSPFLSNSLVFFIGLYGLFNIKNFHFESLIKNKFIICFLIFWIIITIRSFFTDYVLFSLKSSLLFVKYLFFIIGFIYVINKKIDFLNKFLKFFLIVYLVVIFDAFIQFFVGINLLGYDANLIENHRISGFFGDELILGSFIVRFTFLIIAIIYYTNLKIAKIYILLLLVLSFLICLISGERTALALSIMSIIFYFIQTNTIKWKPKLLILIFLSSIVTAATIFNDKISHRMQMTVSDISTSQNILMFTEGHGNHFKTAFNLFKDNKVFGHGANMFRKKCSEREYFVGPYGCSTHPHNIYIQILAETGLLGFVFIIIIFFSICWYSLKHLYMKYVLRRQFLSEYELCILTCFLINFWPIIPTGNFFSSSFGNLAIMPFIFIFLSEKLKKNAPQIK